MPTVPKNELFAALELEGAVNVYWDKRAKRYHTFFRIAGKAFNRSCGTKDLAEAKLHAAKIFAEIVRTHVPANPEVARNHPVTLESLAAKIDLLIKREDKPVTAGAVECGTRHNLAEAHELFLKAHEKTVGPDQFRGLCNRGRDFIRYLAKNKIFDVEDVTRDHAQGWIDGRATTAKTKRNYRGDVRTFFMWCVDKDWIAKNPFSRVKVAKVQRDAPEIIPIETVGAMFEYLEAEHPDYVAYYALATFAGVRLSPTGSELTRLAADVANRGWTPLLHAKTIIVNKPKAGPGRHAPLPPNLKAWLDAYPQLKGPDKNFHQDHVRRRFQLPKNGHRHTAISAFVCNGGSIVDACAYFSTSEAMIRNHYLKLMTPEQVSAFYSIFPKQRLQLRSTAA